MVLAVCALAFMQVHLHRVAFAPLIETVVAEVRIEYAAAGAIMAAYFWSYTALQLPVGILVDRLGARRVMLASLGVLVAATLVFPLSRSYGVLLLTRTLVGVGSAAIWLPILRILSERFPVEERARATGLFATGGAVGSTLGFLAVAWLADRVGWRLGYALLGIPVVVTLVWVAAAIPKDAPGAAGPPGRGALATTLRVLGMRALWPFNLAVFLSFGAYFSVVTWLPACLQRQGFSRLAAGLVTSLTSVGTIVSWPLSGWVADRLGRRRPVFLAGQLVGVPLCLAFAFLVPGGGATRIVVVACLAGFAIFGMLMPFVMAAEVAPPELVGTASGVVTMFCYLGGLVPVAVGAVLDATGSFRAGFLVCAGIEALALVPALLMPETGRARGDRWRGDRV